MANHPDMRVIAWIDTDGINDNYSCLAGNIYEQHIETLIIGKDDMYHEKEDSPYDDYCIRVQCKGTYGDNNEPILFSSSQTGL